MAPSALTSAMATEARLATGIWVAALLRRLDLEAVPAYVTRHGDDTAGAVLVKAVQRDGTAVLFARGYGLDNGGLRWMRRAEGAERDLDAAIAREVRFDPDLWVLEVEASADELARRLDPAG